MTPGKAFLSPEEIRPLAKRSDMWGFLLVGHAYATIAAVLAVFAIWPNPLTFVLAVIVIGSRQLGLSILMHEAAHSALFKTRVLNEWAGTWLCGRPVMADMLAYRSYHLKHHRFTQTEDDPDLSLSRPFPTTKASLRRKIIRDLTGQTGFRQRAQQIMFAFKMAGEVEGQPTADELAQAFAGPVIGGALIANAVIFAIMWAVGDWWWWFAFWALPLLTWFQLVVRIRNIAEHGVVEFSDNPLRNVRTTKAGPVMRLILAPYWVNYHLEHHLIMHVPCHNLPRLHALMLKKGHGPEMEIGQNYWEVLAKAASRKEAVA